VTVTDEPSHPYTQLLLSAAPNPDGAGDVAVTARGGGPSLLAPPSGCRFHPRCPHAMAICSVTEPPAVTVAAGQVSSCWLHAPQQAPEKGEGESR
jgi:peptide/nickel transport system ATP-binding protein